MIKCKKYEQTNLILIMSLSRVWNGGNAYYDQTTDQQFDKFENVYLVLAKCNIAKKTCVNSIQFQLQEW